MRKIILFITCLFVVLITKAQFIKLHDFNSPTGIVGQGSLISDGTFLYGMAYGGGANGLGVIFKTLPDGTGYTVLLDFDGVSNGSLPFGSLIFDGTFLYGMTTSGGADSIGTIFKIKPDGTNYNKLLDFSGISNGSSPYGDLIYDGTFLYGMTRLGGVNGKGIVFKIMPDGTSFTKLFDFVGVSSGSYPHGSLLSDGTFLYGMVYQGGLYGQGTLFKIKSDGTLFSKLLDFSGTVNGSRPNGSLLLDGIFLYGMTPEGGVNGKGIVFKIKPDGTSFSTLLNFSGTSDGEYPNGSLISDGIFLYGMTNIGGSNGLGAVFKIKPDGTSFYKMFDFSNGMSTGFCPRGSLFSDGSFLFGITNNGGVSMSGTVFKLGLTTSINEATKPNTISIYPNPNNGTFNISFSSQINNASIEVYNSIGALVCQQEIINQENSIEFSNQATGLYFVKVMSENKIVGMGKIIKE